MRLFWIRTFEKIDNETMKEVFVERTKNYTMAGEVVMLCRVCKRWVPKKDYEEYCTAGFHEKSREVKLRPFEVDDRVGQLMQKEHEEKFRQKIINQPRA